MKIFLFVFISALGVGFLQNNCNRTGSNNSAPPTVNQNQQAAHAADAPVSATTPSPQSSDSPLESGQTGGAPIEVAREQAEFQRRCDRAPIGEATASPTTGAAPLTVKFDGGKSYDPDKTKIVRWQWGFGDDSTGEGKIAVYTYEKPGVYAVVLNVTDSQGETTKDCYDATTSLKIVVTGASASPSHEKN